MGVCRVAESEGRAICFGDLISDDCVLRRLSEELFALAFPVISTWKLLRGHMASEGSSWPQVRFEELPKGIDTKSLMMSFLRFQIWTRGHACPNMMMWLFTKLILMLG